jgi:hypothetical protein
MDLGWNDVDHVSRPQHVDSRGVELGSRRDDCRHNSRWNGGAAKTGRPDRRALTIGYYSAHTLCSRSNTSAKGARVPPPPSPPRPAPRHRYPLSDRFRAASGGGGCGSPAAAVQLVAKRSGGMPRWTRANRTRRPARGARNPSVGSGDRRGGSASGHPYGPSGASCGRPRGAAAVRQRCWSRNREAVSVGDRACGGGAA